MEIKKTQGFYVTRYCRHDKVTGTHFLYSAHWPNGENVRFFVDAGTKQGEDNIGYFNGFYPFNTEKIEFGIITHNHLDHVGMLPTMVHQGFKGPILTSYATSQLIDITLNDTATIVDSSLDRTISSYDDVFKTLGLIVGSTFKKIMKPHKNVHVIFYTNGHLLGATLTVIVISCPGEEDIVIFHTGDYKDSNVFFNVETLPKKTRELKISSFVCESTYGNVDSSNEMFKKCLAKNTAKALSEGMTVLYPTFAQGRHQEALFNIKMWKEKAIIPEDTKVVIDGKSSQEYNYRIMYRDLGVKKIMKNFIPKNAIQVPRSKDRIIVRRKIIEDTSPKIILAPGGMCSYGPITSYISKLMSRNDVLIHALGYSSPDSTMYKLLHAKKGEQISYNGNLITLNCSTATTSEMSGHSPRNKLLKLINSFCDVRSISLNHGEPTVMQNFAEYILNNSTFEESQIDIVNPGIAVRIESNGITDCFETPIKELF